MSGVAPTCCKRALSPFGPREGRRLTGPGDTKVQQTGRGDTAAVVVPTKGDSYAFRGERASYCVPVVSALSAAVGERWTLRDTSPRSSGSTLERAEEFAEAPREERE